MLKKIIFFVVFCSVLIFLQTISHAALDQIIVWDKGGQGYNLNPTQVATFSAYTWDSAVGHSTSVNTIEVISVDNLEGSNVGSYTTRAYGGTGATYSDLDIVLTAGTAGRYRFNIRASDDTNTVTTSFVVTILGSGQTVEVASLDIVPPSVGMRESSTREFDAIAYDSNGNRLTSGVTFTWVTPEATFGRLTPTIDFATGVYSKASLYSGTTSSQMQGNIVVYAKTATQTIPIYATSEVTIYDASLWDPPVLSGVRIDPSASQSLSKNQEIVFKAYLVDQFNRLYYTTEAWNPFWQVSNSVGQTSSLYYSATGNIYTKVNFKATNLDVRGSLKAIFVTLNDEGKPKDTKTSDTVYIAVGAGGGQPEAKVEGTILASPSVVTNPLVGTTLGQAVGPYAAGTTIYGALVQYQLNRDADIQLYIFDLNGRQVYTKTASSGTEGGKNGYNYIVWDCKYPDGSVVPNGVYILKVISGGKSLASGRITVFQ